MPNRPLMAAPMPGRIGMSQIKSMYRPYQRMRLISSMFTVSLFR